MKIEDYLEQRNAIQREAELKVEELKKSMSDKSYRVPNSDLEFVFMEHNPSIEIREIREFDGDVVSMTIEQAHALKKWLNEKL